MSELQAQFTADTADTTPVSYTAPTATYGNNAVYEDTANQALTVQSMGLDGTVTTSTYTALDTNGNSIAQGGYADLRHRGVLRGDDDDHDAELAESSGAERRRSDQSQRHRRL